MKAIFVMMMAAQRLRAGAGTDDPKRLHALMDDAIKELEAAAELAAPAWGQLTGMVNALEK